MNGKVIRKNAEGTQVLVRPTYGFAIKMSTMKGVYKSTRWIGVLLAAAAIVFVFLINSGVIAWSAGTSWPNWVMFILIAVALALWLAKPSQVMVNNETWVDIPVWERAVKNGTEGEFFKRYWE